MPSQRTSNLSFAGRTLALCLGLLLIPMTLTSGGVQENLACGNEGPDGKCAKFTGALCLSDGELVANSRAVVE